MPAAFQNPQIRPRTALLAAVGLVAVVLVLMRFDARLSELAVQGSPETVTAIAAWLSAQGVFLRSSGVAGLALLALGGVFRRARIRRAGIACLLAGSLAGLVVLGAKPVFGRARPDSGLSAGFHWLRGDQDGLRSFPSGHAMTNSASAVAVAIVWPPATVPAAAFAVGVSASRWVLGRHYPSDVVAGAAFGALIGGVVGTAMTGKRKKGRS